MKKFAMTLGLTLAMILVGVNTVDETTVLAFVPSETAVESPRAASAGPVSQGRPGALDEPHDAGSPSATQ